MPLRPRAAFLRRFARWVALGVPVVGAQLALLTLLHQGLAWPLWLASAAAAEAGLLTRFLTTDRWVFGHPRPTLRRWARFHGAAAGAFVVSWLVLNGAVAGLGVPYVAAALLGTGAAFGWSALTTFLWVWRAPSRP